LFLFHDGWNVDAVFAEINQFVSSTLDFISFGKTRCVKSYTYTNEKTISSTYR